MSATAPQQQRQQPEMDAEIVHTYKVRSSLARALTACLRCLECSPCIAGGMWEGRGCALCCAAWLFSRCSRVHLQQTQLLLFPLPLPPPQMLVGIRDKLKLFVGHEHSTCASAPTADLLWRLEILCSC